MLTLLLLASTAGTALAASPTVPHEHQGIVKAYAGAPPAVPLTAEDTARLQAGEMVQKQSQVGNGGHGVVFQYIHAPPETIWSKIVNYPMYPSWVDNVTSCEIYKNDGTNIYVDFMLSVLGNKVQYYIHHTYKPQSGYLTWTLDYSRQSDLDDSVGYWRVTPVAADPSMTLLEYSVDIRFKGWIPGFVQSFISSRGLTTAVAWVKKQSEA